MFEWPSDDLTSQWYHCSVPRAHLHQTQSHHWRYWCRETYVVPFADEHLITWWCCRSLRWRLVVPSWTNTPRPPSTRVLPTKPHVMCLNLITGPDDRHSPPVHNAPHSLVRVRYCYSYVVVVVPTTWQGNYWHHLIHVDFTHELVCRRQRWQFFACYRVYKGHVHWCHNAHPLPPPQLDVDSNNVWVNLCVIQCAMTLHVGCFTSQRVVHLSWVF